MSLFCVTSNKDKFSEIKSIIGNIKQLDLELDEVQEIDPKKIIKHKLKEAIKHRQAKFIIEDTSLCLDCLNGLPGPLIKWFEKTIGNSGIVKLTKEYKNKPLLMYIGKKSSADRIRRGWSREE